MVVVACACVCGEDMYVLAFLALTLCQTVKCLNCIILASESSIVQTRGKKNSYARSDDPIFFGSFLWPLLLRGVGEAGKLEDKEGLELRRRKYTGHVFTYSDIGPFVAQ